MSFRDNGRARATSTRSAPLERRATHADARPRARVPGRAEDARVVVVLGCAVRVEGGALTGAAGRRAAEGARAYLRSQTAAKPHETEHGEEQTIVVASGGRAWSGLVEADALRDALVGFGVPADRIVRERCSFSTRENAVFVAAILRRIGQDEIALVTCAWHLPRAEALFRAEGMRVTGVPVEGPHAGLGVRAFRRLRERLAAWKDGVEVEVRR